MTKRAKSMLNPSQILMPLCYLFRGKCTLFSKEKQEKRRFDLGLEKKERGFEPTKKAVHQCTKTIDTRLNF